MNFNKKHLEDADSSITAWKYYRSIYTENHWPLIKEFDLKNICTYEERNKIPTKGIVRYRAYINTNSPYINLFGSEFSLGGECDFNFNEKKKKQFQKILNENSSSKEIEAKLEKCCGMHHNELNFTLMPTTGGMNNFKGTVYFDENMIKYDANRKSEWSESAYDRLDTFVVCLNNLFTQTNEIVLSCSTSSNKNCLRKYLDTFSDIYDYCEKIYFIDNDNKDFVNKLIENGGKPINTTDDLDRYMDLALEYWRVKERKIEKEK